MTTWCPCAAKSPCLLSAHLFSLAGCRWTGRCGTGLGQLRGIFSSPVKVLWRMHLESQHWCKHLVTTTLGQSGHNLCISFLRKVIIMMTRTSLQWVEMSKMLQVFLKMFVFILWNSYFLKKPLFGWREQFSSYRSHVCILDLTWLATTREHSFLWRFLCFSRKVEICHISLQTAWELFQLDQSSRNNKACSCLLDFIVESLWVVFRWQKILGSWKGGVLPKLWRSL